MQNETLEYLEKVACIAYQNLRHLEHQDDAEKNLDDQGAEILMSGYLQLYAKLDDPTGHYQSPSDHTMTVARTCCELKNQMMSVPRTEWDGDDEGLFKLMTAFMFIFKHLYVPAN